MAFFRSRMVNLLNLHYGIHSIALSGAGAFFAVYLLKAGLSVAWVLGSLALILAGRFLIRPIVVPLAVRFGMRPLVIAGTCLTAVQYPLLAAVHGVGPALFVLCAIAALGDTFYWSSYHAYFAALGNHEHRGSELGAREAIAAMAGIVSPLATGILLVAFGPLVAFGSAAVLQVSAALPLFFTPEVAVAHKVPGAFKAAIPGIVLFLSLAESFTAFGGALALAALVGAAAGLLLGRLIDAGHGRRAVWYGLGALAVTTILRAVSPGHALLAVIANALGALVVCLYIPTLMTAVYNQAKSSPCALRFHVAAEGAWDVGAASGCLVAATLAAFGVALSVPIMLSLLGAAALFLELRRYYAAHPAVAELALADSLAQNAIVNSGESAFG